MPTIQPQKEVASRLRADLLDWYDRNRRDLPWRRTQDPYAIWISEIMLQQTRVAAVIERYQAFLVRFPSVVELANAEEQEVLALWSGLGYYRRARMLHKAAQVVVTNQGGRMPETAAELRTLPGIGSYTSAAIASIVHGERIAVVDGNVQRVVCRLAGWEADHDDSVLRRKIERMAGRLIDGSRPGDFNQAMMELGATVCLPRKPQCLRCPLWVYCKTRGEHRTSPRPKMASREVAYALCLRLAGKAPRGAEKQRLEVVLEQRPASVSVMPGLWELPAMRDVAATTKDLRLIVRHAIMNVNYLVRIIELRAKDVAAQTIPSGGRRWVPLEEAEGMALTGLTRKVLKRAQLLGGEKPDKSA